MKRNCLSLILLCSFGLGSAFVIRTPKNVAGKSSLTMSMESCCDAADTDTTSTTTRRQVLSSAAAAIASAVIVNGPTVNRANAAEKLITFEDKEYGFQFSHPDEWEKTEQSLADRRKLLLFVDPSSEDKKTLLFCAYTPVRDDFTQLSSFGSVDQVAQTTILPKGGLMPGNEENESTMISSESKKNAYFFDYVVKVPGQPKTHFQTIFTLMKKEGNAGSVLVTLTAQTPEKTYDKYKQLFDDIINSYAKS